MNISILQILCWSLWWRNLLENHFDFRSVLDVSVNLVLQISLAQAFWNSGQWWEKVNVSANPAVACSTQQLQQLPCWNSEVPVRSLRLGQKLTGIIRDIGPCGIFLDVGAQRDGLVQLPRWDFIESLVDLRNCHVCLQVMDCLCLFIFMFIE